MEVRRVRVPGIIVLFVKSTQLGIFKLHLSKSINSCPHKYIYVSLFTKCLFKQKGQESNMLINWTFGKWMYYIQHTKWKCPLHIQHTTLSGIRQTSVSDDCEAHPRSFLLPIHPSGHQLSLYSVVVPEISLAPSDFTLWQPCKLHFLTHSLITICWLYLCPFHTKI